MRVKVLFFGQLKEFAGAPEELLELPEGAKLGAVFEHYAGRHPRVREMAGSIVLARNHEFAPPSAALADGDEVALLPPVSGGAGEYLEEIREGGNLFALTRQPIQTGRIAGGLLRGDEGAVVTFEGVVRNHTNGRRTRYLEYEGYEPMAVRVMARIGCEIATRREIRRIVMVHRLGRLLVGETSVAVIVASAHRGAGFEAAREGIDLLKRRVPIWKKEFFADGEVWVEGEWEPDAPVAGSV
jgi:MoaE-MoaD fusion protein